MPGDLIVELTSREVNRYLVEGGDIAVLPVGSLEVLGPHLPLGARGFIAEAFGRLLAERVDGLRLPLTPFSAALHTFDRPGSVAASEVAVNAYVRAAMDDLLAQGFRRILVLTFSEYLAYYIPQEFYEDHQVAAGGIDLSAAPWPPGTREDTLVCGALRLLGKQEVLDRVLAENARLLASGWTSPELSPELSRLLRLGAIGFTYPAGTYPLSPGPELSPEAGEEALRTAAAALVPAVKSLRDYNDFLAKRGSARGLTWRGWRWTE